MDSDEMASLLYDHTCGYPFLVFRRCQLLDEDVSMIMGGKSAVWTLDGFMEAERMLISEKNTLFESSMFGIVKNVGVHCCSGQ